LSEFKVYRERSSRLNNDPKNHSFLSKEILFACWFIGFLKISHAKITRGAITFSRNFMRGNN
jgi:hypothetical protein